MSDKWRAARETSAKLALVKAEEAAEVARARAAEFALELGEYGTADAGDEDFDAAGAPDDAADDAADDDDDDEYTPAAKSGARPLQRRRKGSLHLAPPQAAAEGAAAGSSSGSGDGGAGAGAGAGGGNIGGERGSGGGSGTGRLSAAAAPYVFSAAEAAANTQKRLLEIQQRGAAHLQQLRQYQQKMEQELLLSRQSRPPQPQYQLESLMAQQAGGMRGPNPPQPQPQPPQPKSRLPQPLGSPPQPPQLPPQQQQPVQQQPQRTLPMPLGSPTGGGAPFSTDQHQQARAVFSNSLAQQQQAQAQAQAQVQAQAQAQAQAQQQQAPPPPPPQRSLLVPLQLPPPPPLPPRQPSAPPQP